MRSLLLLFFTAIVVSFSSCRSDFEFKPSTGGLEFSRDTVYLDTVFTNIGSSTYTLKVYNRSNEDISIPSIRFGRGLTSNYRMTVDGMQGNNNKIFNDVEMLAKDSLYIYIETTADIAEADPTDFLYTDQIIFGNGPEEQTVELVTLIQDAVFLYPARDAEGVYEQIPTGVNQNGEITYGRGFILEGDELSWTAEKPYVIYGYAGIPGNATLTVDAGAKIYFHDASGVIAYNESTMKVNGTTENPVTFEGDRLEPEFADVPGQWFGIWLTSGSGSHEFHNVTIENAIAGLYIQNCDVTLTEVQIYDCANFGIYAQTGTIVGENVVINTAGQATLACTLGGSYDFKHCTFNNYWQSSNQAAVLLDNYYVNESNEQIPFDLVHALFANCIIYGSNQRELIINKATSGGQWPLDPIFRKCLIKFNDPTNQLTSLPHYAFLNDSSEIILNGNPDFFNYNANQLMIGFNSDARGFGDPAITSQVPYDILGVLRTSPDLGAYQAVEFD